MGVCLRLVFQAEYHARSDSIQIGLNHRKRSWRNLAEFFELLIRTLLQVYLKVVECEVRDGNISLHIFQVNDLILNCFNWRFRYSRSCISLLLRLMILSSPVALTSSMTILPLTLATKSIKPSNSILGRSSPTGFSHSLSHQ